MGGLPGDDVSLLGKWGQHKLSGREGMNPSLTLLQPCLRSRGVPRAAGGGWRGGSKSRRGSKVRPPGFSHKVRHQGGLPGNPGWSLGRTWGHLSGPETGPIPVDHPVTEWHAVRPSPSLLEPLSQEHPLPQELSAFLPPSSLAGLSAFHTESGAWPGALQCLSLKPTLQSSQTLVLRSSFRGQRVC